MTFFRWFRTYDARSSTRSAGRRRCDPSSDLGPRQKAREQLDAALAASLPLGRQMWTVRRASRSFKVLEIRLNQAVNGELTAAQGDQHLATESATS